MALTPEQLAVYSADIAANTDPVVVQALADGNHEGIADWYNTETEPESWVFKSNVTRTEMVGSMDWVNEYDPGFKDDIAGIDFIVGVDGYDPRPIESRNALNAVFSGAGSSKANILNVSVRACSNGEKLFMEPTTGPGGGNGSAQAQAALAVYEGDISVDDTRIAVAMIP